MSHKKYLFQHSFFYTDSMCPHIPDPRYGQIYFTEDNVAPFEENTKATYSCDLGYGLVGGDSLRTCEMNESNVNGVWSGEAPSCGGNSRYLIVTIIVIIANL